MIDASTGDSRVRVDMERSSGGLMRDEVRARSVDGVSLALEEFGWPVGATRSMATLSLKSVRDRALMVEATPDAQPLDDTVPMVLGETGSPRVLVIARRSSREDIENLAASEWITQALVSSGVQVREADPSAVALRPPAEGEHVIVCRPDLMDVAGWKLVADRLHEGGMVVVMAVDADGQRWTADAAHALGIPMSGLPMEPLPSARLASRQPRSPLFAMLGAELDALAEPVMVRRRWRVASDAGEAALVFDDGSPALVGVRVGTGVLLSMAFPPELSCTDLPLRPMMVPLFQEMVRSVRSLASDAGGFRSGEVASFGASAAGGLLRSMDPVRTMAIEIDPDGRTTIPVPFPGLWMIERRDGRSRQVVVRLDPRVASIEPVAVDRIEAWRTPIGRWRWIDEADPGETGTLASDSPWTSPLLLLALTLLVSESLWSRRSIPRRRTVAEVGS